MAFLKSPGESLPSIHEVLRFPEKWTALALQSAFISYVNLMSLGKSQPDRIECKGFIAAKQVQWGLAEHLHIVWTGRNRPHGSEGLHFPNREVSSFMDRERNPFLSSHPFLPLPILSLSFPCCELLLLYSLCAEWIKVIRSPLGHIHSWKDEEQLHRLLCQLYGVPSLSSTLSQRERSGKGEDSEATSNTLQHRSESGK